MIFAAKNSSVTPGKNDIQENGLTVRVWGLCLVLAVFFGYLIPIIDRRMANTFLGAQHLPVGGVAVLLLLVSLNPLLRRFAARWAFGRKELLVVYISCLFSCIVPGHGSETLFIPSLLGVFYFGTNENRWLDLWSHEVKPHLTPALSSDGKVNTEIVRGWYEGLGPGQSLPWAAWLGPILVWSSLILAIYVLLACLSVMLRAQWSEREALAFPLLKLPLEMTRNHHARTGETPFFRNPVMWVGFSVAVFIQGINGLATYFSDVPAVPLAITENIFSEAPWNQIGEVPLVVWPIIVAITFLLASEVSFSFWFFFWFIKFQLIIAYFIGFQPLTMPNAIGSQGKVFTGYQHVGAWIAYVALIMWAAREHLGHITRRAFGRACKMPQESVEPLSYPLAFWGAVCAFGFILFWCWMAGISPWVAFLMWGMYLIIAIGLARIVAEGGLLLLEAGWYPSGMLAEWLGRTSWLSLGNGLAPATLLNGVFMVDVRGILMPSFVHSFKIATDVQLPARSLLRLIAAVTFISFGVSVWQSVRQGYDVGALSFHSFYAQIAPRIPAWNLDSYLNTSNNDPWGATFWTLVGVLTTLGLMLARSRFAWLPFHPIGLLVSLTSTINQIWLSLFIGWVLKTLVIKFGGNEHYRRLVPAALGLVLGEVVMIVLWLLIDGWQGRVGHRLLPG